MATFAGDLFDFITHLAAAFGLAEVSHEELDDVISDTLRLWSYLHLLGGKLQLINPSRGDLFRSDEHAVYDIHGAALEPSNTTGKNVFLVRCRGIRWYQDVEGRAPPALILKARVLLQDAT